MIRSRLGSYSSFVLDVLLAYWVTSRVWWTYHTLASSKELRFESLTITVTTSLIIIAVGVTNKNLMI